ncbi:Aldo/keto reductase family-domain-containing protein [Echria macrotheca]|uniref:Aldo/keto reductase family-domain-containing protein n=1 Tax=Echria macrotheca TaxID=438768 RepID=A0AAJ0BA52_9PEZI|nr:Aldo/keto reductase family-domain-containing protein [Echria macrotheca]
MSNPQQRPPLNTVLPPLILGTATFNTQYVADPLSMPYRDIVARAIALGVNAFDTSPYYGPSEILLGTALKALMKPVPTESNPTPVPLPRSSFKLITKAGRIGSEEFDYSPAYIRYSVLRSLQRLHTPYLDLVYTHDVEFVSPDEVVGAVRELRRLRDEEGLIRYVGISGYPVDVLCSLAEKILAETGEPLDAVLSFCHFTIQDRTLGLPLVDTGDNDPASPLSRLKAAGVNVVLNASMLGMGLLTSKGIPADPVPSGAESDSPLAKWHPSPPELRLACKELARIAEASGERLESVAIRWSLEEWARVGALAEVSVPSGTAKVGASVCGVSSIAELEETVKEWRGVLSGKDSTAGYEPDSERREKVMRLVKEKMWPALGRWKDYAWQSPRAGYVNRRRPEDRGQVPDDGVIATHECSKAAGGVS